MKAAESSALKAPPVSQVLRLQSALEEAQLSEKQLRHKLELQTETLNSRLEELRALNELTQSSMTSEMMEGQLRIGDLEDTKVRDRRTLTPHLDREGRRRLVWRPPPPAGPRPPPSGARVSHGVCLSHRWSWSSSCRSCSTESSSWT